MVVQDGKNTIYDKFFRKEDRELEGDERGTREERESEILVLEAPFLFSHQHGHAGA